MADTKITALTALTAADPANDVIPIVDVSDTTMAASGTTKKISVNNILGASGTATLASATITGAATVGTTLGVTGVSTLASAVVTGALTSGTTTLVAHAAGYTGKVGIGTATPTAVLTVNGEISVTDNFALRLGSTQAGGATLLYNGSGNLDITPRSGFHTKLVDGNLIIGTSGKGIDFSAVTGGTGTATANVLNDYEEGTFTPTIVGSTSAGLGIYVSQTGRYTKIGNQVTVWIYFYWTAHTGTGDMSVDGLPFTIGNLSGNYPAPSFGLVENIALTAGKYLGGYGNLNSTKIILLQYPTGGGAVATVPIDSAAELSLTMTYRV